MIYWDEGLLFWRKPDATFFEIETIYDLQMAQEHNVDQDIKVITTKWIRANYPHLTLKEIWWSVQGCVGQTPGTPPHFIDFPELREQLGIC